MRFSVLTLMIVFFFSTETFAANKLKLGETHAGTLHNLYLHGNNFLLPPGSWKVSDLERDGDYQWVGFENNNGSYAGAWLSLKKSLGVRWVATNANCLRKNNGTILANGEDAGGVGKTARGTMGGYAIWCVMDDGNDITFSVHILGETALNSYYYFPKKIISINKNSAEKYGERVFLESLKAYKGNKSANLSFLSEIIGKNISSSSSFSSSYNSTYSSKNISTYTDEMICLQATSYDGLSWEKYSKKYYDEALKRRLSIETCNDLTNRIKVTSKDSSSVKSKLSELKDLLDEGLISQDDYNKKKNELLEEF